MPLSQRHSTRFLRLGGFQLCERCYFCLRDRKQKFGPESVKRGTAAQVRILVQDQKPSIDFSLTIGNLLPGQSVIRAPGVVLWP